MGKVLSNRVDGVARNVCLCYGMGGNIRCRKGSPCSTRAKGVLDLLPQIRLKAPMFHMGERQSLEHFVIEMLSESSGARLRRSDGVAAIHLRR